MDNLIFTLLTALVATINANAGVIAKGATAAVGRIRPLEDTELPFIAVFYVGDETTGEFGPQNTVFQDWNVSVAVELYLSADAGTTPEDFVKEYLNLRADVFNALATAAPTQGLPFVSFSAPIGADEPVTDDAGNKKTVSYRTNWLFRVRTSVTDMTTF